MARYIDEKVKTDISQYFDTLILEKADWFEPNLENIKNTVLRILDNTPTADVAPVRHGEWIQLSEPRLVDGIKQLRVECSNCKIQRYIPAIKQHGYYCCPNCGAIMDGGNKNE